LAEIEAIIFDFIGTLTDLKGFNLEASELKLYKTLFKEGFKVSKEDFLAAYKKSNEKYRLVRYQELIEVTNTVWISDALNYLGFKTKPEDTKLKTAVNVFVQEYLNSLQLKPCATQLLTNLKKHFKLGLISNFTYAPVIFAALKKLGINWFFNAVLVSEDVGWRKPNPKIFQEALKRLEVNAEKTVYVGDSPKEDIGGASALGMKTIFLPSQFYTLEDLHESKIKPDLIVRDTCELCKILPKFIENMEKGAQKT
jgi:HAD superfamily hydrolase (TIGR01549 family)